MFWKTYNFLEFKVVTPKQRHNAPFSFTTYAKARGRKYQPKKENTSQITTMIKKQIGGSGGS
jgi:hypothetical protein